MFRRRGYVAFGALALLVGALAIRLLDDGDTTSAAPSIANLTTVETDDGARVLRVPLTLAEPADRSVSVHYTVISDRNTEWPGIATLGQRGQGGADVVGDRGTVRFAPGAVVASVPVHILGDTEREPDEHFSVHLSRSANVEPVDAFGVVTLLDDDTKPPAASVDRVEIREGNRGVRTILVEAHPANSAGDRVSTVDVEVDVRPDAIVEDADEIGFVVPGMTADELAGSLTVTDDDQPRGSGGTGRPQRVALVGDSITSDYQFVAKRMLEHEGFSVYLGGDAGSGLLDRDWCSGRRAEEVLRDADPDLVVLQFIGNIGFRPRCSNDPVDSPDDFEAAWNRAAREAIQSFRDDGAQLFVVTSPGVEYGAFATRIATTNAALTSAAKAPETRATVIDGFNDFGGERPDHGLRSSDLVHLNAAGADRLARLVVTSILDTA